MKKETESEKEMDGERGRGKGMLWCTVANYHSHNRMDDLKIQAKKAGGKNSSPFYLLNGPTLFH